MHNALSDMQMTIPWYSSIILTKRTFPEVFVKIGLETAILGPDPQFYPLKPKFYPFAPKCSKMLQNAPNQKKMLNLGL